MASIRRLTDQLLDAAVDGGGWDDALLSLARHCRADVGSLVLVDRASGDGRGFCLGVGEAWSRPFVRRKARHVAQGSQAVAPGAVFTDRQVIDRRSFEASHFFQSWAKPSGQTEYAGVAVLNEPSRFVFVGLARGLRKGAFDGGELAELQRLAPGVKRAARVWIALGAAEEARRTFEAAFEQMEQAVFLTDAQGRVQRHNLRAQALLNRGALRLDKAGALACDDAVAMRRLERAVAVAAEGEDEGDPDEFRTTVPCSSRTEPMTLHVSPLRATPRRPAPGAAVMIVAVGAEDRVRADASRLRKAFGLTRSESLLAAEIVKGGGIKAAAKALRIAPTTARTHLGRVFDKTGARSQVELVGLLSAGLPRRAETRDLFGD